MRYKPPQYTVRVICKLNDYSTPYRTPPNANAVVVRDKSDRTVILEVGDEAVEVSAKGLKKAIDNCTNAE